MPTDDVLTQARIKLVRAYLVHPQSWPDGIEPKAARSSDTYDRWYTSNRRHWDDLALAETVTKIPPVVTEIPVTKTKSVTKIASVTKTPEEVVTRLKQVGRPKTGKALSAAERMRRKRAKANAAVDK